MNELIIALISGVVTLITSLTSSILVFKGSQKKIHADQEAERRKQMQDQDEKINSMQKNITKTLSTHKDEYITKIGDIKDSITHMQSTNQQFQAIFDLRIDNLEKAFTDMKIEVREHNNFAKRMPVVEEKISAANKRIKDIEDELKK